jgi:succinate dehydrogenase / fumarate reductase, iron-sulfur subunit
MKLTLKIWRQKDAQSKGKFVTYQLDGVAVEMSFLEMLDYHNEKLIEQGEVPVDFDSDCREGICGMCGLYINGRPHGPAKGTTTCQLQMHHFKDGDTIVIEPWRAKPFPVIRDLIVDRSALDKIIFAGGYISVDTGSAPEANSILVPKHKADMAFNANECVGCGACVATCPNASAMLFTAAKVSHLSLLPQGKPEAAKRVKKMVAKMDELGFGNCSNSYACEIECPKEIKVWHIAHMNREFIRSGVCASKKAVE